MQLFINVIKQKMEVIFGDALNFSHALCSCIVPAPQLEAIA